MIKNSQNSYGIVTKTIHWLMAILIICLTIIGFNLKDIGLPLVYKAHKTIGFFILLLVLLRILWRFNNIVPKANETLPKWMQIAAKATHLSLYILMILVPLSAFIASNAAQYPVSFLFLFDMPLLFDQKNIELAKSAMQIHKLLAFILAWFIALHVSAALYHHFIVKDNTLKRMWKN
jgi:cytochrome b561